jgi:hypothetical protein
MTPRSRADHQVEGRRRPGQLLGRAHHKTQPVISSGGRGHLDHGRRRVDPGQDLRLRGAGSEPAQQVTGPAPDVEYAPGSWHAGQGQVRRTIGDLVVHPATPALVIAGRALAERCDITITGHT